MEKPAQKMVYESLGRTGLKVSRISFGNWLNSDTAEMQDSVVQCVKRAWELGVNFFDTAEAYGSGEAERQFGKALKALGVERYNYVLSTKIFWGPRRATDPNELGLSRKHIIDGLRNSLKRLDHQYVDIVFCHRFDNQTPLEEVCRAFDWVVTNGLAHYWGTSEWSAAQIFEALMYCEKYNLTKPVADQCEYNMFNRTKMEVDYARLFDHYGLGTTVWSPLAGGILTGKYNDGFPDDSRLEKFKDNPLIKGFTDRHFGQAKKEALLKKLRELGAVAQQIGCSQAQLAMAWVLAYPNVSTAITSATKPEQLEDIVQAFAVVQKITPEIATKIEDILQSRPEPEKDFRQFGAPFPHRR